MLARSEMGLTGVTLWTTVLDLVACLTLFRATDGDACRWTRSSLFALSKLKGFFLYQGFGDWTSTRSYLSMYRSFLRPFGTKSSLVFSDTGTRRSFGFSLSNCLTFTGWSGLTGSETSLTCWSGVFKPEWILATEVLARKLVSRARAPGSSVSGRSGAFGAFLFPGMWAYGRTSDNRSTSQPKAMVGAVLSVSSRSRWLEPEKSLEHFRTVTKRYNNFIDFKIIPDHWKLKTKTKFLSSSGE